MAGKIEARAGVFLAFRLASRKIDVACVNPIVATVAVRVVDPGVRTRCGAALETVIPGRGLGTFHIATGGDAARAKRAFV